MAETQHNIINNITFDKNGNLMIGYPNEKKIEIYNPALTKKIDEIDFSQPTFIKIKKNKVKEIQVKDTFFLYFFYQNESNSIYCYFSNGNLIQKFLDVSNQDEKQK